MRSQVVVVALLACSHSSSVRTGAPVSRESSPPERAGATVAGGGAAPATAGPPRARTVNVTETQFGVTVSDPYRWMEGNDNPELNAWLVAQGEWTRRHLARLAGREALRARIGELGNATGQAGGVKLVAGKLFYFKTAPGEQLRKVMMLDGGKERLLVEPARFESGGGHASIDGFAASPDGRKLAFNVSKGGGENATMHVLDLATGNELADRVERVPGGVAAVWLPDGSGFFYLQKGAEGPGVDPISIRRRVCTSSARPPTRT